MTDHTPPRPTRRWPWVAVALVVVGAVAAGAWIAWGRSGSSDGTAPSQSLTFGEVVRTDLEEITTLDGTLGRAEGDIIPSAVAGTVTAAADAGATVNAGDVLFEIDAEPVVLLIGVVPAYRDLTISEDTVQVVARSVGTITAVVAEGATITEGDVIYEVDGRPVVALFGDVPAYRTLRDASDNLVGDDVLQLETALAALGYGDGDLTVDGEFTAFTETIVEQWQEDVGAEVDGVVDLGEVVFISGTTEVTASHVVAGDIVSDGRAVIELAGAESMEGADVRQLEENLAALGFDPGAVDGIFDAATKLAVRSWQEAAGLDVDGVVNLGEVVFFSGAVRVAGQATPVGSPVNPGGVVLNVTSSEIVVSAELPAADQDIVEVGTPVVVELPDNSRIGGIVTEIDSVATRNANNDTVFDVTIVLDDPAAVGNLDEAPVEVDIITDSVSDVIAVPVTALLALAEGGYAVELDAGDGQTRLVGVDPGFFADGLVEIKGGGLEPGDRVVIP